MKHMLSRPARAILPALLASAAFMRGGNRVLDIAAAILLARLCSLCAGGALRTARDGELSAEEASRIAQKAVEESLGLESGTLAAAYPMLYDNRAEGPVYVVYCCTQPVTDVMPESYFIVSLSAADGTLISVNPN